MYGTEEEKEKIMEKFMVEMSEEMKNVVIAEQPKFRVLSKLADEFRKYELPIKCIGKVKIDVNEEFFEDEAEAQKFIENMAFTFNNIYKALQEEFGEDAKYIFSDMASEFSIKYSL
jgi:hypothetical protein